MRRTAPALLVALFACGAASVAVRAEGPVTLPAPQVTQPPFVPAPVRVKPIMSTTTTVSGQPIVFPQGPGRVVVGEYIIAPGAVLPLHQHPFPRFAYVLQGQLEVENRDAQQTYHYKPGDVVIEMIGQNHLGRNIGNEPVRLIVFDTTPANVESNVTIAK